jgi:hypothetical protein
MNGQETPQHYQNLIWRVLDDGVVVVSPQQGQVRVLNGVGTTIWELIDGRRTITDLEAALIAHYDVQPEQAGRDLRTFLEDLTERGLLVWMP